jgi:hypothetical protein
MSDAPDKLDTDVVTTVALSLEALIRYMQAKFPGVSFIYDEQLGYETGIAELRASNSLRDGFNNKLPAMFFKRSVLRYWADGHGRRSVVARTKTPGADNKSARLYRQCHGEYDVEFNFVTPRMSELENFEISWLSENGIPELKDIKVDVPTLGELTYHVRFEPLEDKYVNSSGNFYKTVVGRMIVQGQYYAFEADAKIIREINDRILTFSKVVLSTDQILPK